VSERPSKTPFTTHLSKTKKSSKNGWLNCGTSPRQDSQTSQTNTTQKPQACQTLFPYTMLRPTPALRCKESKDGAKRGNRLFHRKITTSTAQPLPKATHLQTTAHQNQWPTSAKTKTSSTSSKKCNFMPHPRLPPHRRMAVRLSTRNTRPC
jgi:cell wall-associated NlpC family hydrolase